MDLSSSIAISTRVTETVRVETVQTGPGSYETRQIRNDVIERRSRAQLLDIALDAHTAMVRRAAHEEIDPR